MPNASTLLLASLCTLTLLGGCAGNKPVQSAPELTQAANQGGPWFCQPSADGDDWDCDNDPLKVANPIPDRRPPSMPAPAAPIPPSATSAATTPDFALDPLPAGEPAPSPPASAGAVPDYQRLAYQPGQPVSLLELPANYYVVQLTAMRSAAELEAFFRELQLEGLSAAQIERDGDLFYVLLLGVYENFATAERAATDLPSPLDQFDPWIRRLGTLQAAMLRAESRAESAKSPGAED